MGFRGVLPRRIVVYAAADSAFSSLSWVVIPPYLKSIGFTALEYGIYGSVITASAIASLPLAGWASDRFSLTKLIAASMILHFISTALIVTGYYPLIYCGAFITGIYHSLAWIAFDVLISRVSSRERYHYAYQLTYSLFEAGGAVGAFMGWIPQIVSLSTSLGLPSSYRLVMIASAAADLTLLPLILGFKEPAGKVVEGFKGFVASLKSLPSRARAAMVKLTVFEAIVGLGAGLSIMNISYYFILKYGVGSGGLGTMYGFESLAIALLGLLMPRLSDRVGNPLRAYAIVSSSSIPLLVAITLVNNYALAAGIFIARSVLMNVATPLLQAFTMYLIPDGFRGKAMSFMGAASDLTRAFSRGLGGYLLEVNLEAPLRITAAVYTAAIAYLFTGFRGSLQRNPESA